MSLRKEMAALIGRVRQIVGDPAGSSQVFGDHEIQDALDRYRADARYVPLTPLESYQAGGKIVYLDYVAEHGDWEEDARLYSSSYAELSPSVKDYLVGRWTFAADTAPPVYLVGKSYDPHAAAADLLERWAAKVKLDFSFMAPGGGQFTRSQKHQMLLEQARACRAQSRPRLSTMVRGDVR